MIAHTSRHDFEGRAGEESGFASAQKRQDAEIVRYMRERLYAYVSLIDARMTSGTGQMIYLREPQNHQHRVVLLNMPVLQASDALTFVAFFGEKRADADAATLDALDHELIREFHAFPHLISYSSLELADGSWANLVLMSSPEGIMRWAESQRHQDAAHHVAPTCYRSIRLHRGTLNTGIAPSGQITFARTKHFAFAS